MQKFIPLTFLFLIIFHGMATVSFITTSSEEMSMHRSDVVLGVSTAEAVPATVSGGGDLIESLTVLDVITESKSIKNIQLQGDFIVKKARFFLEAQTYPEAVQLAEYVLKNVDEGSLDALQILQDAREGLKDQTDSDLMDVINDTQVED